MPKYTPFCVPEITPPASLTSDPWKSTPLTARKPPTVPLAPSELMVPLLVMSPVNKPVVVPSNAPPTRVRSRRIPSPAVAAPAPASPRPASVPEFSMVKLVPLSLSSAEKPAPWFPAPASMVPELLTEKLLAAESE